MDSFVKADIFFFITTIAVVVLVILVSIALVYLIRFLRDMSHVSKRVREEGDEIINDISEFRASVKKNDFGFRPVLRFVRNILKRRK